MTSAHTTIHIRQYEIVELLGRGGFAKVYRARPKHGLGESWDVAIKILNDPDPPEDVLQRFRDESRILGMMRDRAIVQVEPARRLGSHWAVIMEYIPGASCRALLKHRGPFPARVALEVAQEVSRALDQLYKAPGPDGRPLHLVHRDIKPGNIQLTRSGQVKILDFGVARARFEAREAHTTRSIQGTYGYIAPERLLGRETSAADVFSLGMVLYKLITGGPTERKYLEEAAASVQRGATGHALALALHMCEREPEKRPAMAEVVERCQELASRIEDQDLATWAAAQVPARVGTQDDPLVGEILTLGEPRPKLPPTQPAKRAARRRRDTERARRWLIIAGVAGFNAVLLATGVAVFAAGGVSVLFPVEQFPTMAAPKEPQGLEPRPREEAPMAQASSPEPRIRGPKTNPTPMAADPPVVHIACDFGSHPLGADVILDGEPIGTTPIVGYDVPHGAHELQMRLGGEQSTFEIDVGKRKPTRFVWKRGNDWEVLY